VGPRKGFRVRHLAMGTLAVVAMMAMEVPWAEARVRIRSSGGRSHSAPSVSKPHVPTPKPGAPAPGAAPRQAANAVSRSAAPSMSPVPTDNRGFFRRTWDWLLGRRAPTPAPAPQAPAPAAASAVAAAPAAPAPVTPTAVVPVPAGAQRPAGAQAAAGPQQDQDQRRLGAPGAASAVAAAAGGAAGGTALAAALQQSFGKKGAGAGDREQEAGGAAQGKPDRPAPKPSGYVLHLTNGRTIPVASYEEKGDQVLVSQPQGSYGLPKTLIARIEPRITEADLSAARGPR